MLIQNWNRYDDQLNTKGVQDKIHTDIFSIDFTKLDVLREFIGKNKVDSSTNDVRSIEH